MTTTAGLTPEAARAAAEWLETTRHPMTSSAQELRAEADRLESAAKTPGQVAYEAYPDMGDGYPAWGEAPKWQHDSWNRCSAAVIAHHVGPDRIVVDKYLVEQAWETIDNAGRSVLADRLREALS